MRSAAGILIALSACLATVGVLIAAAFYALIPGYRPLYMAALVLALVLGLLAFRQGNHPDLRGPASLIIAACVIYWSLAGAALPLWANGPALITAPVVIGAALLQLWRQYKAEPAKAC
jgi:hypothetical protein